jgi:hypothetical protein
VAILAKGCQLGDMRGCTMVGYLEAEILRRAGGDGGGA